MNFSIEIIQKIYSIGGLLSVAAAAIALVSGIATTWASKRLDQNTDQKIAVAESKSEEARKETAILNARTEELRGKNLELQIQLENERTKRLKLQDAVGPRKITPEQASVMVRHLSKIVGKAIVHINCRLDYETQSLALQLNKVMQISGVETVLRKSQAIVIGTANTGIQITIHDGNGAAQVRAAFENSGLPVRIKHHTEVFTFSNPNMPRLHSIDGIAARIHIYDKPGYIEPSSV